MAVLLLLKLPQCTPAIRGTQMRVVAEAPKKNKDPQISQIVAD
jgi:hypothetical protein